nr:hypothetical protein Iba_chr05cCG10070 [Ipomoea batatas]
MVSGSVEGAIRFSEVVTFDNNFEGELVEKKERIEEVFTQLGALNYIIFEGEGENKISYELQNLFERLSTISKENEELKVQCFKEKKRYRGIKCTSSGAELAQEVRVRESEMTPFSREDMLLLEITPIPMDNDMDPPPPPMPTFPPVPPHYATVTNWTTMQAFHHQLHLEAMARQHQFHLENMERQQRAEEAIHRALEAQSAQIDELREQFMRFHPHPPPE